MIRTEPGKTNFTPVALPWNRWLRKKFHEAMLGFLPVVGHIPPKLRLCMGLFYLFLLFAIFIVLFVTGYYADMGKVFLSPVTGDLPDDNCDLIAVENTGKYLATMGGIWQRSSGFIYSEAAFLLSLFGYTTNKVSRVLSCGPVLPADAH